MGGKGVGNLFIIKFILIRSQDYESFRNETSEFLFNHPQEDPNQATNPTLTVESQHVYDIEEEDPNQETEVYELQESESHDSPINIENENSQEDNIQELVTHLIQRRIPNPEEREIIIKMIYNKEELMRFPLEVFAQTKDEEDFIDTVQRLVLKFLKKDTPRREQPILQKEIQKKEQTPSQTDTQKKEQVPTPKNQNLQPALDDEGKRDSSRKNTSESPKRRPFEFKVFMEQNAEKFSNEEYGIMVSLHAKNDDELQAIVYQCQNIKNQELVLKLFKSLAETRLIQFLIKTFESKEIQYMEKFKKSKNSPIFQAFLVIIFKMNFI